MDINLLRSIVTVVALIAFIGIVVWAWKGSRRKDFEAAAQLPFADTPADDLPAAGTQGEKQ